VLFGKKTKPFSLIFQKKKKLNIATVEPCSTVLLLHSCGWAAKTSKPYQVKSSLLHLPNIKICGCG
jgi:hypothetical protein